MNDDDAAFKALADESRRTLLDALFQQDGQSLSDLCQYLPTMTRHGVMKHLQVLEEAGLLTTQKVGREKFHYLNPVPIQTVYDRWVSKYAQPWAQGLSFLKQTLEGGTMSEKPKHIYQTYIRTTPEKLWQALTDGSISQQYYMDTAVESSWEVGSQYIYRAPDGTRMIEGEVLEYNPYAKLVMSFEALWLPQPERGEPTTVSYEIEPFGAACKLTLTHYDLNPNLPMTATIHNGWAHILSGLKTLLETGEPLVLNS